MATNKSMIDLLKRQIDLIDEISERVEELKAMRLPMIYHVAEQKRQGGSKFGEVDEYRYVEHRVTDANRTHKEYVRIIKSK